MKNVSQGQLEFRGNKVARGATTKQPDKSKHNDKSDKDFVKLKLRRDPISEKSDLYESEMALFDNDDPEEFLLFVSNFNMTPKASGTIETAAKVQHLRTIVRGE